MKTLKNPVTAKEARWLRALALAKGCSVFLDSAPNHAGCRYMKIKEFKFGGLPEELRLMILAELSEESYQFYLAQRRDDKKKKFAAVRVLVRVVL